jgi:hypothetical protein
LLSIAFILIAIPAIDSVLTCRKWVDEGVMTIEQLKKQKLNHQQQIGVQYFEDIQQRIPRDEMDEHFALIKAALKKIDPEGKIRAECCGS